MTRRWGKLDTKLYMNDKFRNLPATAAGIWLLTLSWSADNETDGLIPRDVVAEFCRRNADGRTTRHAGYLVKAGLWDEVDGGYMIHDFADYQLTKVQKAEVRAADATRQTRSRATRQPPRNQHAATTLPPRNQHAATSEGLFPDESVVSRRDILPKSKRKSETRETSSLVRADRRDASTLIDEWVGLCADTPPKATRDRMNRELKKLLAQYPYDIVRTAMLEWFKVGGYGPAALSGFVYTAMNPKNPAARPSTTDTRVLTGLALAAKYDQYDQMNALGSPATLEITNDKR